MMTEGPSARRRFEGAALDYAPDPIVAIDYAGRILCLNRATEAAFLYSRGELLGRPLDTLASPAGRGHHRESLSQLLAAARGTSAGVHGDLCCRRKDDIDVAVRVGIARMGGAPQSTLVVSLVDQIDHSLAQQAQQQMTALVDSAEDAILTKALDGIISSWNPAAERLLGYRPDEILGKSVLLLIPEERRDEELMILDQIRRGQRVAHFETVRRRRDGSHVEVSLTISPVRDRSGTIIGASKIMRDITDRNRTLALLQSLNAELEARVLTRTAELEERECLLQEIHHRVKNNLQVISSLINMQTRSLEDVPARAALRQCQLRVATMAQIHEMLYQSKSYARVPFARYAKDLAQRVLTASGIAPSIVALHFALEDIALPVEQAIPAALILNELLANSLKHAFPEGATGIIHIALQRIDEDRILLSVGDDGIGVPTDDTLERGGAMGMQLVHTLARQLDGQLDWTSRGGINFRLQFPAEPRS